MKWASNIVSNVYSTKLVSYTSFTLLYFLVLLLHLSCPLRGLITQKTINTWGEKGARHGLPPGSNLSRETGSKWSAQAVSYSHVAVKVAHFFTETNYIQSCFVSFFKTTTSIVCVFFFSLLNFTFIRTFLNLDQNSEEKNSLTEWMYECGVSSGNVTQSRWYQRCWTRGRGILYPKLSSSSVIF